MADPKMSNLCCLAAIFCSGVPARITPHTSTGRADYFGQLVNRAARYCHTAAHGGQVVASRELIDELVSTSVCSLAL
jgi:hypothetical protein